MSAIATDPRMLDARETARLARLVARYGEEDGAQVFEIMATGAGDEIRAEVARISMLAASIPASPDEIAAILGDALREEFADVAAESSTATEHLEDLTTMWRSAVHQMALTARVILRPGEVRIVDHSQGRSRGTARTRRHSARTGSSLSRGDPPDAEGDRSQSQISPLVGTGSEADSGTGRAW
jgi:hypothetical protein